MESINKEYLNRLSLLIIDNFKEDILDNANYVGAKFVLSLAGAGILEERNLKELTNYADIEYLIEDYSHFLLVERFRIPYFKRTIERLLKQKELELYFDQSFQKAKLTEKGIRKIVKHALSEIELDNTQAWEGNWYLVSYYAPKSLKENADTFRKFLVKWGFKPVNKSLYIFPFPCQNEVAFLTDYCNLQDHVTFFEVTKIANEEKFKQMFGI